LKQAFTLLELVFVIVIIGILAAVIIPKTQRNTVSEARIKLQSDIRYTQHLAMIDDKYNSNNDQWYKNRWRITFNENKYSLLSDTNTSAVDPLDKQKTLSNIDLETNYGVAISLSGGYLNESTISFDNNGRPHVGDLNSVTSAYDSTQILQTPCVITLSGSSENDQKLTIFPETGYVSYSF